MAKHGASKRVVRWIKFSVILVAMVWLVRATSFDVFLVPSGSMQPSLAPGDRVLVSKLSYRVTAPFSSLGWLQSVPSRGDVVVFRLPSDEAQFYIKRIIGLSGDTVQLKGGRLYLNDEPIGRSRTDDFLLPSEGDRSVSVPSYLEALSGSRSYRIVEAYGDHGALDTTELYHVPAGQYFVMGDNRDNSVDSRVFSEPYRFVPEALLVGKQVSIF